MSGDRWALRVCAFPASKSSITCQLYQVQNQCQTIFGICNGGMFFSRGFFLTPGIWSSDWAVKIGCDVWGIWVKQTHMLVACCYSSLFPPDTNQSAQFFLCMEILGLGRHTRKKGAAIYSTFCRIHLQYSRYWGQIS